MFTEGFEFTESVVNNGGALDYWNVDEEIVQIAEKRQVHGSPN